MKYIWNGGVTDASVNLALEEYVLRHFQEDDGYLLFYVNAPAIILGRNQIAAEEINSRVVADRGIQVVRRMSGGGAVYHDTGNLNFSFITSYAAERFNRYDRVNRPIIDVLRDLGVEAEIGGRNDIIVDGRKISGNAQFVTNGRMFSHGTLLIESNLDDVARTLRPKPGKVEANGTNSVRGRVANVREFLADPLPLDQLRRRILARTFGDGLAAATRTLTADEWRDVYDLAARKYGNWDWNYGGAPPFTIRRRHRFPGGEIDARILVRRGRIEGVRLLGDYLGRLPVSTIESRLVGIPYVTEALLETLAPLTVGEHLGGVEADELADFIAG